MPATASSSSRTCSKAAPSSISRASPTASRRAGSVVVSSSSTWWRDGGDEVVQAVAEPSCPAPSAAGRGASARPRGARPRCGGQLGGQRRVHPQLFGVAVRGEPRGDLVEQQLPVARPAWSRSKSCSMIRWSFMISVTASDAMTPPVVAVTVQRARIPGYKEGLNGQNDRTRARPAARPMIGHEVVAVYPRRSKCRRVAGRTRSSSTSNAPATPAGVRSWIEAAEAPAGPPSGCAHRWGARAHGRAYARRVARPRAGSVSPPSRPTSWPPSPRCSRRRRRRSACRSAGSRWSRACCRPQRCCRPPRSPARPSGRPAPARRGSACPAAGRRAGPGRAGTAVGAVDGGVAGAAAALSPPIAAACPAGTDCEPSAGVPPAGSGFRRPDMPGRRTGPDREQGICKRIDIGMKLCGL